MARIYLIRHGDTQEKDGEIILSETGIQEAQTVAKKLKQITFSKVFSSKLPRAIQTAAYFTTDFEQRDELNEIYRLLIGGPEREGTPPHRLAQDKARADTIWEELNALKGNVAVFCHGNIIRYFLMKVLHNYSINLWDSVLISNGSITVIEGKIHCVNNSSHLPQAKAFLSKQNI